ncbi:MAG: hypothetical protein CVU03_10900 [Bacteroidetes bacterium HGW-Bacteroidetes-2]|nr:MAG: hypothetical protein CVU03_10900 [Bacteroidetes bacterium HGW-Bacteroidetes-2]
MKTINKYVLSAMIVAFLSFNMETFAQVGIGTTNPDNSSMLDIQTTSKGILIPRMTSIDRTGISAPANGLLVFDTTTQSFWFYKGSWTELSEGVPDKIVDANGDTRVEVEQSANENIIRLTTEGIERMTIDDTGVTKIGDIAGGNSTKVEADGTLVFEGNAEVWDDLRVSMDKGSSSASLDYFLGSSGGQIWYFRDDKGLETLSFQVQLPHSYKEGTNIYPHLHWSPKVTKNGYVKWNLDYTWVNYDASTPLVFPANITSTVIARGPFTAKTHLITGLTTGGVGLNGTGKKVSSILICRLWRDSGDSQDTYTDDAGLLSLDFHYQIDMVGSRTQYTK